MVKKITVNDSAYSSHFEHLLHTKKRVVICFGGRGSGKTHHIIIKQLLLSFENTYNKIVYVNKEFRHIKTQQYSAFKSVAKSLGLYDYFKWYDGDYRFINTLTGVEFIPVGMDDFEKTKGIDNPTVIWWDEINKGTLDDYLALNALLRTPLNPIHQFIISFNPVSEKHWLRSYFFKENNAYEIKDSFDDSYLNHSTYMHNDFIDKEAYRKTLEQNAIGNINRMLVDIEGKWGIITNETPYFYALNNELNFGSSYEYSTDTYIDLAFDFNHTPSTIIVSQERRDLGKVFIFDLIQADINTFTGKSALEAVCTKFKMKYPNVKSYMLRITGDATGKSSTAGRAKNFNFYTDIMTYLNVDKKQIFIRKANLSYELSRDIVNEFIFKMGNKLVLCGNTQMLQDTLLTVGYDYALWKKEAEKNGYGHEVDAFRYYITDLLLKAGKKYKQDIERFLIGYK